MKINKKSNNITEITTKAKPHERKQFTFFIQNFWRKETSSNNFKKAFPTIVIILRFDTVEYIEATVEYILKQKERLLLKKRRVY